MGQNPGVAVSPLFLHSVTSTHIPDFPWTVHLFGCGPAGGLDDAGSGCDLDGVGDDDVGFELGLDDVGFGCDLEGVVDADFGVQHYNIPFVRHGLDKRTGLRYVPRHY